MNFVEVNFADRHFIAWIFKIIFEQTKILMVVNSTGGRNTLIFEQRWSVSREVSSSYLLQRCATSRDLNLIIMFLKDR